MSVIGFVAFDDKSVSNEEMEKNQFLEYGAVAEWSKALALGANPKGRGFKPHRRHFVNHRISFRINYSTLTLSSESSDYKSMKYFMATVCCALDVCMTQKTEFLFPT